MLFFFGCSSSQETTTNEEEEIYVFDEVPDESISEEYVPPVQATKTTKYVVQIGAFTTEEKAETFATESRKILDYQLDIEFSPDVELFVVQLPPFNTRAEAEKVRNTLWKNKKFTDAFILSKEF
jgi:cell division protein FtsN